MKRITAVILALVMCLSLSACGQTDAAKAAQKAISQIGTVTESSESAITDAENLFNHLTEEEKSSVKNSEQLVNARKTYETILEEKKLQSVTSLIDAIGSVSLTSEEAITKSFSNSQINRDNTSIVWETADYVASVTDIEILRKIASSSETIIRFQGSNYSYDHTVTAKEKTAITDVLTAYEYLSDSN